MPLHPARLVPERRAQQWRRVRRKIRRHRRALSAVLAATCLVTALRSIDPGTPATVEVVVAARDLPGGAVLRAGDVGVARLPSGSVPVGAVTTATTGRTLAGPMRRGEPLTDVRLVGSRLAGSLRPGLVATPVRLADAGVGALIRTGDLVDVLAAPADPAGRGTTTVAAAGVLVLAVPEPGSAGSPDDGALVLLATTRSEALALAGDATADRLSVTWQAGPAASAARASPAAR